MSTTATLSKQSKKQMYFPYIAQILNSGRKPVMYYQDTGGIVDKYFVLGGLPGNRLAVYIRGAIYVATSLDGFPQYEKDCPPYKAGSVRKFYGRNYNIDERDLVNEAKKLIKFHYSQLIW
jgi:hypothetical protein